MCFIMNVLYPWEWADLELPKLTSIFTLTMTSSSLLRLMCLVYCYASPRDVVSWGRTVWVLLQILPCGFVVTMSSPSILFSHLEDCCQLSSQLPECKVPGFIQISLMLLGHHYCVEYFVCKVHSNLKHCQYGELPPAGQIVRHKFEVLHWRPFNL